MAKSVETKATAETLNAMAKEFDDKAASLESDRRDMQQ
jgi:hypothetical protein